ncbi:sensor histidine kinase [Kitasatospora sp. NPDC050543]|uniref:sensor histidine kinase n=1 Tax=Kitasatospora sp. NPDC050543 TaxID=3364054 RepID=UPI00378F035C
MQPLGPIRRWRGHSKPKRMEVYTRWSLYLVALIQPPVVLLLIGSTEGRTQSSALLLTAVTASVLSSALSIGLFRAGLEHFLGRRPRPTGWLAATAAVVLAMAWLGPLLDRSVSGPVDPARMPFMISVTTVLLSFWMAPLAIALPLRQAALLGSTMLALLAPPMWLAGLPLAAAVGAVIGAGMGGATAAATCRGSAWMVSVVWELDGARETQARLAVAEERLRFSRDLHDVMGRNLTTIALKSELAVQLARRGRPEAADQMTEVQRIAQESQREVRDVVRGYRSADLQAEAIGARAVLRAADIDCRIDLGDVTGAIPASVQSVLGWVVREATTNVLRHSEAARCSIRLRLSEDGRAVLDLENDGVPADPAPSTGAGTGLEGLRERLAALGGELTRPPAGPGAFRLRAVLPLTTTATALEATPR